MKNTLHQKLLKSLHLWKHTLWMVDSDPYFRGTIQSRRHTLDINYRELIFWRILRALFLGGPLNTSKYYFLSDSLPSTRHPRLESQ
jgi:hypothetical protein